MAMMYMIIVLAFVAGLLIGLLVAAVIMSSNIDEFPFDEPREKY